MNYSLYPFTPENLRALKTIRLTALQQSPAVFGGNYETEAQFSDAEWQQRATIGTRCQFGLYHHNELIGLTGVMTDREDASGQPLFSSLLIFNLRIVARVWPNCYMRSGSAGSLPNRNSPK